MKTFRIFFMVSIPIVACWLDFVGISQTFAATAPNLGVAASYAAFGKAGVTNDSQAGTTHVW